MPTQQHRVKKIKLDSDDVFQQIEEEHVDAVSELRKKFESPKNYENVICVAVLDFYNQWEKETMFQTYYGSKKFDYRKTFIVSLNETSQKGLNHYRSELKKTKFFFERHDLNFFNTIFPYKKEMKDYVVVFTEGKEEEQAKELAELVYKHF